VYALRSQLARHVSSKHVSFTHDCIFAGCSKSYAKPSQLHAHLQSRHGVTAHQCAFADCNKLFLTHIGLRNHVASKHPAITFHCVSCSSSFSTASELRWHSLRVHAAAHRDPDAAAEAAVRAVPRSSSSPRPPPPPPPLSSSPRSAREATPFSDLGFDDGTSSAIESSAATTSASRGTKRGRSPASRAPDASLPSLATPLSSSFSSIPAFPDVKGPRALYSSPVAQPPLTRSSRQ
jgi:hypothetical protein